MSPVFSILLRILGALLLGFLISLIVTGVWKSKLRSVRSEHGARRYMKTDTFRLYGKTDTFLYRTTDKTAKPRENRDAGNG